MFKKAVCDVSIVCANFNNGKYIKEFVDSVISSTVEPKELIIVDDGSKDNSVDILSQYNLSYLILLKLDQNIGFANALNKGVNLATGKYLLRVDPDDILHPKRLQFQSDFLERNEDIDLTGSNAIYFRESLDHIVGISNFPMSHATIAQRYLKGEHGLLHGTIMGKTCLFRENKYEQSNVPAEDYDIFSRMIKAGALAQSFKDSFTYVRIHKSSVSNDLPMSTIKKTYHLRNQIFKKRTSLIIIIINFISLKYYRRYFFEHRKIKRFFYLIVACLFRPDKALKKILSNGY